MTQNILLKTNRSIIKKYYTNIPPHNFDPARLLTIHLLHSLNRSMWVAIFPQKVTPTVCLGFFINPSSMAGSNVRVWKL